MRQVFDIAYYETLHIMKDKVLTLLIIFVPLFYAFLCGAVYVSGVLTGIPLGVVDLDHSRLSREVVFAFENSPRFKIMTEVDNYPLLEEGMKTGAIRAGVLIPEDFEKKAARNSGVEVLTVYDGSNLLWGYNIRKYTMEVVNQFHSNHAAAYMAGMGLNRHEIYDILDTVSLNVDVWYNPTFNYATFMLLGIMMMVIHQICLLAVGITVTREKERNCWIQYLASAAAPWKIFLGKSLPYFTTNCLNYGLLIWFNYCFIHVKTGGSLFLIILLGLLYAIIITGTGFFISLHAPNSLLVTRYLMLLSVPFFIISGYTWPQTHVPDLVNILARALPFTWMAEGFRLVALKNLNLPYLVPNMLVLSVMAILSLFLALTFTKQRKPPADTGVFDLKNDC